jgi:putative oxygen-independent coproporphyrinogen III oxidase
VTIFSGLCPVSGTKKLYQASNSKSDFGVYIHWPFCKAKCPYCDFNSHVRHEAVDAMSFAKALAKELKYMHSRTQGRMVSSIFFGGGTPSLMPPKAVAHVLDTICALWRVNDDAEITLEANPTSVEAAHFRGYRAAGVNRVSVGVQALNEADLKALGRQHTPDEALQAFKLAAQIFPRVSFDLIYARPGQTPQDWRSELAQALAEQQGHMSLYQLTIEPETRYFDLHEAGKLIVPPDDLAADLYDITQELTEAAGLAAYEISNHAKAGHESRHNLTYWRYGEYAGVGPGAHSRLVDGPRRFALSSEKHPETWRQQVESHGDGIISEEDIDAAGQIRERLLMGLRIAEGIAREDVPADDAKIAALEALGLIHARASRIAATRSGRLILNSIIHELAA